MTVPSGGSRKSSRGVLLVIIARENFGHAPLARNHALIITANEIKTIEQPENSMEIDVLSLQAGFLVRFYSQIHDRLSFLS